MCRLNGNSFQVHLILSLELEQHEGWVMNFSELKASFAPIFTQVDHYYVNDIRGLRNMPSDFIHGGDQLTNYCVVTRLWKE